MDCYDDDYQHERWEYLLFSGMPVGRLYRPGWGDAHRFYYTFKLLRS
jgi:hypothetical protein